MRIQYLLCHFPAHLWVFERDKKNNWIRLNTDCTRQINTSLEIVRDLAAQKHQPLFRMASITSLRSWRALEVLRALQQFQICWVLGWFWSWGALVRQKWDILISYWVSLLCWLTLQNWFYLKCTIFDCMEDWSLCFCLFSLEVLTEEQLFYSCTLHRGFVGMLVYSVF